jgi:hypothetical protein
MNISVRQMQGRVPVTVLGVQGALDASNYQDLIAQATEARNAGARDTLLDLTDTSFISSSGLVALHSIALLMRGEQPPSLEEGWGALQSIQRGLGTGTQQHFKLLGLQPYAMRTLEKAGMIQFFEIHTDLDTAIASF